MATAIKAIGSEAKFIHRDAKMAFRMSVAMAAVIVTGFAFNLAMGRSTMAVPIQYHLHALVFFGWTALFVIQTGLAARGQIASHKRLGRIAFLLFPLLLVMGVVILFTSLRRTGGPFFFAQNEFMWGSLLLLGGFAGLVIAAVRMRQDTAWHSRLMLTSMAVLTGPGFGRLLPMPLLIPWAWQASVLISMLFPLAGMLIDLRKYGSVHRAWIVGVGAVFAVHFLSIAIAHTAPGIALTEAAVAGTQGSARSIPAYLP